MYEIPTEERTVYITSVIHLTDRQARPTNRGLTLSEPAPGSVLLVGGETGVAWQRWFSTGLWHKTGGSKGRPWDWMLSQETLVLAYSAPERV